MKITEIEIEQFGPWNQLSLPIAGEGLTVVSGGNESGKSALRRFIRGVLFGFQAEDSRRRPNVGALQIRHRGRLFEIRRAAHDGRGGLVTSRWLTPANAPRSHGNSLIEHCDFEIEDEAEEETLFEPDAATLPLTDALSDVVGGLSEKLFDQIFSLGLSQLHELSHLADDDVAKAIHGETLGPFAQTLLAARRDVAQLRSAVGRGSAERTAVAAGSVRTTQRAR